MRTSTLSANGYFFEEVLHDIFALYSGNNNSNIGFEGWNCLRGNSVDSFLNVALKKIV